MEYMNAFIVIQYDLERLNSQILSHSKSPYVMCVGLYELTEVDLNNLQIAEKIYCVVSKDSICSTAYQSLLLATFPLIRREKCYLLKLDDIKIPLGFSMLENLPEDMAAQH